MLKMNSVIDEQYAALRVRYIELVKNVVLNSIYEPGPHIEAGKGWPQGSATTMVGRKRLNNLHNAIVDVIEKNIEGDLLEAGAWRGGSTILMKAVLEAYSIKNRRVFVADSFKGIPPVNVEKYPVDAAHVGIDKLPILVNNSIEQVKENFRVLDLLDDSVVFLEGWFKDTLPKAPIEKLAVLRLDGDIYESTWDTLINLYHKVSIGGYIIIDDYALKGAKEATNDFRNKNEINAPLVEIDHTGVYWIKE